MFEGGGGSMTIPTAVGDETEVLVFPKDKLIPFFDKMCK